MHNYGISTPKLVKIFKKVKHNIIEAKSQNSKKTVWVAGEFNTYARGDGPVFIHQPSKQAAGELVAARAFQKELRDVLGLATGLRPAAATPCLGTSAGTEKRAASGTLPACTATRSPSPNQRMWRRFPHHQADRPRTSSRQRP